MKKAFTVILFFITLSVIGQQKAVTDSGDEVILYDDGTWKHLNTESLDNTISLNDIEFTKNDDATFLLKSKSFNVGFWINPKKWSFSKSVDNLDAEYELILKGNDLYGMVITEKIPIPLETLKNLAYENGKIEAPDLHIVKEEYRIVNGLKILFLQMNGSMQGIKFSYYGYYYSNDNGSLQFITYTSQNLLKEFEKDCEALLNGIVEL